MAAHPRVDTLQQLRFAIDVDDLYFHVEGLPASIDLQLDCTPDAGMFELIGQIKSTSDRLTIGTGNDVSDCFGRRIHSP